MIPKLIAFASKYRLSDVAGRRASHEGSIPIFGGVAFFVAILISLIFFSEFSNIIFLSIAIIIVFFVGMLDDLIGLSPYTKLIGQIISILIIISLGDLKIESFYGVWGIYKLPEIVSILFTVFVCIVIINSMNLIDGIDGLAAGTGSISTFCFGLLAFYMNQYDMSIIAFSLLGALIAFLKFNFHPAKIFMGDTGSLLIGLILSILAINLIRSGIKADFISFPNKGPFLAIVFLALPLFDSLRIFISRLFRGKHPLHPGRGHIHHALLRLGFGHRKTSVILFAYSVLLISLSFFFFQLNINLAILFFAIINFCLLYLPFYLYNLNNKTKK
ncbi:MAG: undecaprenyl-phosphate alpha-N-acetylglucosaminyl 1-phosphate transferase [Flavobacteriales bacterium]|nr:undecaprenyl-phosphate alpha-N-acetylglucosaminyl 1-phosphate transferase [Flavobacteriales bacterium]|tara:strand:- start:157263 stop:158252 length:990 start_codon:yes stop_codon:yes gene_type:complete